MDLRSRDTVAAGGQSDTCSTSSYYMVGCEVGSLEVTDPPTPPRYVKLSNDSPPSIKWRTPSNWRGETLTFDVRSNGETICANVAQNACQLNSFSTQRNFLIEVQARNTNGVSSWSTPLVLSSTATGNLLTVSKSGSGSGTVVSNRGGISCGDVCLARFTTSTRVVLRASASAGSRFVGWSGSCRGARTCSVSMSAARSVTARFEPR